MVAVAERFLAFLFEREALGFDTLKMTSNVSPNELSLSLETALHRLEAEFGTSAVNSAWTKISASRAQLEDACTIVVNEGVHSFPSDIINGEKYVVYYGDADFGSDTNLNNFIEDRLAALAVFLKSKPRKKIFLVISGHAVICLQVKMLIYRILHVETVDWAYVGGGGYYKVSFNSREFLTRINSL